MSWFSGCFPYWKMWTYGRCWNIREIFFQLLQHIRSLSCLSLKYLSYRFLAGVKQLELVELPHRTDTELRSLCPGHPACRQSRRQNDKGGWNTFSLFPANIPASQKHKLHRFSELRKFPCQWHVFRDAAFRLRCGQQGESPRAARAGSGPGFDLAALERRQPQPKRRRELWGSPRTPPLPLRICLKIPLTNM